MKVWREGQRIRKDDGTGYSDRVTDGEIREHIAERYADVGYLNDDAMFAAAVLALRSIEASYRGADLEVATFDEGAFDD